MDPSTTQHDIIYPESRGDDRDTHNDLAENSRGDCGPTRSLEDVQEAFHKD